MLVGCAMSACGGRSGQEPLRGEWLTVVKGDRLSKLASRYRIPIEDVIEVNGIRDPSLIHVGQRLFMPHFARDLSQGDLDDGSRPAEAMASVGLTDDNRVDLAQLPGFRALKGAPVEVARQIRWPLKLSLKRGVAVSSGFGRRSGKPHKGLDIRAPLGTPVRAVLRGEVIRSDHSQGGYGRVIYVRHAGGLETRYAHHKRNLVRVGQVVEAGTEIGLVGSSGRSTGPHLHFEIRVRGEAIDPLILLPALP